MKDEMTIDDWEQIFEGRPHIWDKANEACIIACGMDIDVAWNHNRGCYTAGLRGKDWMSPNQIARGIIHLLWKLAFIELEESE